ncbi:hypothetical protein MJD09_07580 [bacterium]|nr:hypothetical protein [bacterium]
MLNSLRYILTIASIERTMLYRTAKFWVLAGIGVAFIIFFLVIMTIVTFVDDSFPGEFLLQGTDAYLALYFFSYIQVIIIIFVAGDFRKAEEKARLDEVMLSQPMTTANWVLGKYLGVVSAILYLNLFLLLLATVGRVIKALFLGAGFNIIPFLQYFGMVTLPSILFMTALLFFLVSLLRAQSIAVVVSLGYVASILFYFRHKFLGLFDYGAFFAPLFSSDFIGFGDIEQVLWQRLFFVLLAFTLVGFSILLYPRLGQSFWSKKFSQVFTGAFLAGAALVAFSMIQKHKELNATRKLDLAFHRDRTAEPICKVTHYDFDIKFGSNEPQLQVTANLALKNPHQVPLAKPTFSLNGELAVSSVQRSDGSRLSFEQKHQVVIVDLSAHPLQPAAVDSIEIGYAGGIDAEAFMLQRLPNAKGLVNKSDGPWTQGDMSAWIGDDVVVLPAQSGWYPSPASVGSDFDKPAKNFATANIVIETHEKLTAITQGKKISQEVEDGLKRTQFAVQKPVPGFSLNIAEYLHLACGFRQTNIELYVHPNHLPDYEIFTDVADTCYEAVESILGVLEDVSGAAYPYPTLALVEVPLQMQVYTDRFGINNVLQQPGVVMIDEVTIASKRLKREVDDKTKRARRRGRDDSPERIKRDVFVEIVLDLFFNDRPWRGDASLRAPIKNYVNFQFDIRNAVLDRAVELLNYELAERQLRDLFYPDRRNFGLSSYDRMRQNEWGGWTIRRRYGIEIDTLLTVLRRTPLTDIRPEDDGNLYRACIDFKAPPILMMLSQRIDEKQYIRAIQTLVDEYRYQSVSQSDFLGVVQNVSKENVQDFFAQWFEQATFPGYRITRAKAEKLDTGKMNIVYQVTARVQNGEQGDGFVRLVCEGKNNKIRRNLKLASYEEKEVRFAIDEEPKRVKVIPYFSRNRGTILKEVSISRRIRRGVPVDTMYSVQSASDSTFFVVDDQDKGFFTPAIAEAKYLRPPSKGRSWWERTNPFAYGKYYFGWRVKRAGEGDYPARWETTVPRDGEYELGFYYRVGKSWVRRNVSRTFQIKVTSMDGTFPVEIRPQDTPDGWFPLGRFHFSKEEPAVIELADEGSGVLVADAIRWEFVE